MCTFDRQMKIAVDIVLFGIEAGKVSTLLIERKDPPFNGRLALPGGLVRNAETLSQCALRTLNEKLGLSDNYLDQLGTFDDLSRDPRERIISVAYIALVRRDKVPAVSGRGISKIVWGDINA